MDQQDMINKTYGRWTVLSIAPSHIDKSGRTKLYLHCKCECGTEKDVSKASLLNGRSQSCGCRHSDIMHNMFTDNEMIGKRFGRGVVQECIGRRARAKIWKLKCDCGNEYFCDTAHLNNGHIVSCGCYHRDDHTTHGGVANKERLFGIWMGMRRRCCDPKRVGYDRYGGRGIKVCEEWDKDYSVFREWAYANGYQDDLTIDRIDFNGDYCPENCRWITRTEQTRNTSYNRYEEMDGVVKSVAEWMDDYHVINKSAVYHRLRNGWSMHDALFTPIQQGGKPILPNS